MKIGNIIHKEELVNHTPVDYINYVNISNEFDHKNLKEYNNILPTLYVGWGLVKNIYNNSSDQEVSILNKEIITNKQYWEFSFSENKSEHINGVQDFVTSAPYIYFNNRCSYEFINPIFLDLRDVDDLFGVDFLPKKFDVYLNYMDSVLYLLNIDLDDKIYGFDLKLFNYLGFDTTQITNHLKTLSGVVINDLDGKKVQEWLEYFNSTKDIIKYMPVILNK